MHNSQVGAQEGRSRTTWIGKSRCPRSMGSREDAWDTNDAGNEDMVIRAPFCICGCGQRRGAGSAQIPLRGISSYSAIITTVDSSWRIRRARARAQLWRNHNGTSSTPRAELRVEHKLGGLAIMYCSNISGELTVRSTGTRRTR